MRLSVTLPLLSLWAALACACYGFGNGSEAPATVSEPVFALDAGTTWSSLYRDYFGPTGVANCAGDGTCHGGTDPVDKGFWNSGFLCSPDAGEEGCYEGITHPADAGLAVFLLATPFTSSFLDRVLCKTTNDAGIMPYGCTYRFTPTDLERIGDWVEAGAPDN